MKPREKYNTKGELTGYQFRVYRGRDSETGKQLAPYTTTWHLPDGWFGWSKRTQTAALNKAKVQFELDCKEGKVKAKDEIKREAIEAARIKAEKEAEESRKPDMRVAFDLYVKAEHRESKKNTIVGIYGTIKRAINFMDNKKVELITTYDCQEYMDYLYEDSGLAVSTIRKHYSTLAAFLRWCFEEKLIPEYPMKKIKKPADTTGKKKLEIFSVDELKKIIERAQKEDPMWRALILFLIDSGCRRGESVGLKWSDIDLISGRVEISNNAQYTEKVGIYDTSTKSKKTRVIYINEQTISALKEWKKLQKEIVCGQNKPVPTDVFTHMDGTRISPQAPTAHLRRFGEIYGIEDCHPHKFRHSMATHMIRNGADIKTVSEKLGHSTIAITLELYVHSDEETQKAANKKYSDILWN